MCSFEAQNATSACNCNGGDPGWSGRKPSRLKEIKQQKKTVSITPLEKTMRWGGRNSKLKQQGNEARRVRDVWNSDVKRRREDGRTERRTGSPLIYIRV